MDEVDNMRRAEWAHAALDAFGQLTGQRDYDYRADETFREIAGDLLADLLHAADMAGVDPDELIEIGRWHYDEEVNEE